MRPEADRKIGLAPLRADMMARSAVKAHASVYEKEKHVPKVLSKTTYLSGLQCEKRLWLELNRPEKATPTSRAQQYQFDQGAQVGLLARDMFPHGVAIEGETLDLEQRLTKTRAAMTGGAPAIFEAAFFADKTHVLADIITRNDGGSWNLYEVKASTEVKDVHIPDLAVQKYVMGNAGAQVDKTFVMHVNRNHVHGDPNAPGLFATEDVTSAADALLSMVGENLQRFLRVTHAADAPDIVIGPQCSSPNPCPFIELCWQPYGNRTVFDIPRLSKAKQEQLRSQGILLLAQLPEGFALTPIQRAYVQRMLGNQVEIDAAGIREQLATLIYPLYFLDFETDSAVIPRFDGTRPYQQIPFQYSCHTMTVDGAIRHSEYLHEDKSDPRPKLIESLLTSIGEQGSVVVYYAGFERSVLQELAAAYPQHAPRLQSIAARLWDQLEVFRRHYKHAAFGNSNSIKHVLPVLAPQLGYEELNIQDGADAQAQWNLMLRIEDEQVKVRLAADLRVYCRLDTLAMVEIHKVLWQGWRLAK